VGVTRFQFPPQGVEIAPVYDPLAAGRVHDPSSVSTSPAHFTVEQRSDSPIEPTSPAPRYEDVIGQTLDQQSTSFAAGGLQQPRMLPAPSSIPLEQSPGSTSSPPHQAYQNPDPASYPNPNPTFGPPFQQQPFSVPYISQQPPSVPQMVISPGDGIGGNRNAYNKPYNAKGQRDWSFRLCDCFSSCQTCLYACCCPCIAYGQNISRLRNLEIRGIPHPKGGEVITPECLTYLGFLHFAVPCCYAVIGRKEIRERYSIEGNACQDCLHQCFCIPCAITQESREIDLEERSLHPMKPLPSRPGFVA